MSGAEGEDVRSIKHFFSKRIPLPSTRSDEARRGPFGLRVEPARLQGSSSTRWLGVITLKGHGAQNGVDYTVHLHNYDRSRRANAYLSIDGKSVGSYRLNPDQHFPVERPPGIQKRFTFWAEAGAPVESGIVRGRSENGLVSIRFVLEKNPYYARNDRIVSLDGRGKRLLRSAAPETLAHVVGGGSGFVRGGTGLSGHSDQRFSNASWIDEDPTETYSITIQLVGSFGTDRRTIEPLPSF